MKIAQDVQIIGLNDGFTYSKRASIKAKDFQSLKEEQLKQEDFLSVLNRSEGVRVIFQDEESSKFVSLNLTKSNFARIIKHFNQKDNYFLREDGAIRLNGEAQNFIAGWFKNAAYDLNYLKADADKNGLIQGRENENLYLYNSEVIYTPNVYKGGPNDVVRQLYLQGGGGKILANDDKERSLDEALNAFLAFDKNADKKISILELEGSKERVIAKAKIIFDNPSSISKEILEKLKRKSKEIENASDEAEEKNDATNIKNKALEQGLSALNMSELLKLKEQYPEEYEQLKQKDLDNLSKDLNEDLKAHYESLKIIDQLT
ncbi:hypothetical protein CAUP111243_01610 [Campylobacter upsaliensis]|uniref:EF-hand domain-containing protein n=1 Tax=Campylobacter upsaliensis TaxID=28080 RepID=A0A448KLV6_CAMUP|nr:hypothetical protein [Campylobacter upsaliensis]EAI8172628.1 hypothetical protein [Campylobacter upsaliensis]EAK0965043.1 hypothetical protein [Campylobacter upsaliensis]EAL3832247.1 hypothetical protein [Campylobacter upsaliensis]EAL3915762.1 hypothetical protein [Campylobacter upsaliensis]EAL3922726.1 hypothetical protein [Campylobacter upsaliensis]